MIKQSLVCIPLFLMVFFVRGFSQLSISGPACVVAGTVYQYIFSGVPAGASNMQVCITGGTVAGTDSSCHNGTPVSFIRIVWNTTATGSIAVSGAAGNASLSVNKTSMLLGGKIDSLSRVQAVHAGQLPSTIVCSDAGGGNCSPVYTYQWQQSSDGMHWSNMTGMVSKQLKLSSGVMATIYYRRNVMETVSKTEQFSDPAIVLVTP